MAKENPHSFKLVSNKPEPIPNSPLVRVGLAVSSSKYYAAAVDPITKKNYALYANITSQGPKFGTTYKDIIDNSEHNAVSTFFLKSGVFEEFYNALNWIWSRMDGQDDIPPWFKNRHLRK